MNKSVKKTMVEEGFILPASIIASMLCVSIMVIYSRIASKTATISPVFILTKAGYFGTFLVFFCFYPVYLLARLIVWVIFSEDALDEDDQR